MNNEIILQQLKRYFSISVDVKKSENYFQDENISSYDFIARGTRELAGRCELNKWGRLVHFERIMDLVLSDQVLSEEDILPIGKSFIRKFYPDIYKDYELSTVFNMREIYSIYFEKKEKYLNVTIPYVGFNIGIAVDGQIVDFSFDHPKYEICYLDQMISPKEAKGLFLDNIQLQLAIEFCDRTTYINGDNNYHLLYKVDRLTPAIPASGKIPKVKKEDIFEYIPICKQDTVFTSIYEALGMDDYYNKLGVRTIGSDSIEVWSKLFRVRNYEYSMYLPEDHVIKIAYDWRGKVKHILCGEFIPRAMEKLSFQEAKDIALNFLFFVEPKANEKFLLRINKKPEIKEEVDFDKYSFDQRPFHIFPHHGYEEMYRFLFQRVQSNVFVLDNFITIGIGKYTGRVRFFQNTIHSESALGHLNINPLVSKKEAKQLYDKALHMELALLPQFQGNVRVYSPGYLAKFAKEHHYVEAIDAHTGNLYEINLNDPIPY